MKIQITIDVDEHLEEQILENAIHKLQDIKKRNYSEAVVDEALRAVEEDQLEGTRITELYGKEGIKVEVVLS